MPAALPLWQPTHALLYMSSSNIGRDGDDHILTATKFPSLDSVHAEVSVQERRPPAPRLQQRRKKLPLPRVGARPLPASRRFLPALRLLRPSDDCRLSSRRSSVLAIVDYRNCEGKSPRAAAGVDIVAAKPPLHLKALSPRRRVRSVDTPLLA